MESGWLSIKLDPFTLTLTFIVLATLIAAFVRRIKRDKCLRDFADYHITLARTDNKQIWGKLRVENTGLELIYDQMHEDKQGHDEASYILYKHEYSHIQVLLRFHDQLTSTEQKRRQKQLDRTYHPNLLRRLRRKISNLFKTIRDSMAEVINLLIARVKKTAGVGAAIGGQDKYVNQMRQELMGSVGTSYEPLLERYIGHHVVLEMVKGDQIIEYSGILKNYTAEFIEVMDVSYTETEDTPAKNADLVVPRQYGLVRHRGE